MEEPVETDNTMEEPVETVNTMEEPVETDNTMEEPMETDNLMYEETLELSDIENLVDFETEYPLPEQGNSSDDAASDEEVYKFQFEGEMDPLAFAEEEDESGVQPYQRFEMIQQNHYESLAAKKRKAISDVSTSKRLRRDDEDGVSGAGFDELMESMGYGRRRKSKKDLKKRRGRRKGSKNKANSEALKKLGEATLKYSCGDYEEAIPLLKKVILIAPNLYEAYHTLGLIYDSMGNKKRAFNFYLIAVHLNPKNASLWKLLVERSSEQGDKNCVNYCLGKAITADPTDIDLRTQRATLFIELGEYKKAAYAYEQVFRLAPNDIRVLTEATELYIKSGDSDRAVCILEEYMKNHVNDADLSVVDLFMKAGEYAKALELIELAQMALCAGEEIPLDLTVKAGICHVHLRQFEKAEAFFGVLQPENMSTHPRLIDKVANTLMDAEQYESALNYYNMLVGRHKSNGYLHLRIAGCYESLKKEPQAIENYYKAIEKLDYSAGARLTLSSLLVKEGRDDEAISVLSPPVDSESASDAISDTSKSWWRSGKIKLKLSQIYRAKGLIESFVGIILPVIRETLFLETVRPKAKVKKRLSKGALSLRVKKVRDGQQTDTLFHVNRPLASSADLSKAARAKKLLQKRDKEKEVKRAAAIAAGIDWKSDDDNSEDESPQVFGEPPLPDFLKDELHHRLILDLCKSLSSLEMYWEALDIINLSLKLASNTFSVECKEELRTLGAQISYHIADPARSWEYVKKFVTNHPHSFSAWNCCYKVILRNSRELRSRDSIHRKFLHHLRGKYKDSVPPIVISAHLFTLINQHQAAAREYLEAHKLMPDNPFINLCVGTAMINLALDIRLLNKHQTVLQGLAFLYNNSRLCNDSQESLYNIARAYHHIGLVSLAVTYYEKVLEIREKDHPIPVLPNENPDCRDIKRPGYCDLRREAAYNLHLIYKKSGALDLARQVLKDHVFL